jgi:hypothetical protein
MTIEIGKKYSCGRFVAKVLKVEVWDNTIYFESNCPWFTREEDGSVAMPVDEFERFYTEHDSSPFEVLFVEEPSDIDILGMYEICLN